MKTLVETISIEPMLASDLDVVYRIDHRCFPLSWQKTAFQTELGNRSACYLVARLNEKVVGFGGIWAVAKEAHLTTIAVDPDFQGRKIGEKLLLDLIEECLFMKASHITLEVRESNFTAQNLYRKYGFVNAALRRNYYTDNGENALVMWALAINTRDYRELLDNRRSQLKIK